MPQTRRVGTTGRQSITTGPVKPVTTKNVLGDANKRVASKKRAASDDAKAEGIKRPAFNDITNAANGGTEKATLKSQVKKGLSNIVSLKNKATANASGAVRQAKRFKLSSTAASSNNPAELKNNVDLDDDDDSEVLLAIGSQSLPSSQEDSSLKSALSVNVSEEIAEESEYESAEEENTSDKENVAPKEIKQYLSAPRLLPPVGVNDFDLENWHDHLQCSEYAMDIFNYYKSREEMFRVPDYMADQPEINKSMRAILIDWLVEVQESFELNHETLYTAVKMMDLFLSRRQVKREDLQLVGATACLIACKIDERIPPLLDDFVYVCDNAYSRRQITAMEREMISIVDYDVGYPLTYRFLRRYGRVCKVTMPVLTFSRYILEMSLLDYSFNVELSESKVAAAALVVALKINGIQGWAETLKFYSGYSPSDLRETVMDLLQMLRQPAKDNLKTIRQKYSHKVFHEVALTEIPVSIELNESG